MRAWRQVGPALFVALVLGALWMPAASAQATGGGASVTIKPVIGVLDLNHVMTRGQAARGLVAQRETFVEAYQSEVADTEIELRNQDQELMRQRATLAPEAFTRKRQEFQDRVNAFQQQVQGRRDKLERAFGAAMATVQGTVIKVTKEIAEERGMNIVLYRSQTFLFDPQMDITDAVLAEVNKRLPSVTMQDPDTLDDASETEKEG